MTQWNDQAPLSRRQARERERQGDGAQAVTAASAAEPENPTPLPFGAAEPQQPAGAAQPGSAAQPASAAQPGSAVEGERMRGRRASAASVDGQVADPPTASVASAAEPGLRRRDARVRAAEPAPEAPEERSAPSLEQFFARPEAAAAAPQASAAEPAPQPIAAPPAPTAASAAEPGSRRARRAAEQALAPSEPIPAPEPFVAPEQDAAPQSSAVPDQDAQRAPRIDPAPISDSQWAAVTQLGSAAEPSDARTPSFWSDAAAREVAPQPVPEWAPPAQLPGTPPTASATGPEQTRIADVPEATERAAQPIAETPQAAPVDASQPFAPTAPAAEASEHVQPAEAEQPEQPIRRRGTWQAPDEAAASGSEGAPAEALRSTAPQPFARPAAEAAPAQQTPAAETIVPPVGPGVGHWSRQSEVEDDTQGGTGAIGRGMGFASHPTSTNSLVLPSIPEPGSNLTGPLSLSGEVLLTGSMELPRSLGSSGADPRRYDTSEVDRLFDQGDYEEVSTDSTPVLAARAISSHSATRGLVAAKKPRGNRNIPAILAIGAGVAAVIVIGLFVVMVVNGGFSN